MFYIIDKFMKTTMTRLTKKNKIRNFIINSIFVFMMNFKIRFRTTNFTFNRKVLFSKAFINSQSIFKIWMIKTHNFFTTPSRCKTIPRAIFSILFHISWQIKFLLIKKIRHRPSVIQLHLAELRPVTPQQSPLGIV